MKVEIKEKMSRADAAAFFKKLADQITDTDDVELSHQGVKVEFGVPDEVELEVELEIEDGKTELEIELHW